MICAGRAALRWLGMVALTLAILTGFVGRSQGSASWTAIAPLNVARTSLGSAALGSDGHIYVAGGDGGAAVNSAAAYSPSADTWTALASMPSSRVLSGVASAGGKIYVIGGDDQNLPGETAEVDVYTPATDTWSTAAPMPTPRDQLAVVTGSDGRIYAIGGHHNYGIYFPTVEAYSPTTNTWGSVTSLPQARVGPAAAAMPDGSIYVFGGYNKTDGFLHSTVRYDPATAQWQSEAPMPTARWGAAAVLAADGRIYVMGGFDSTTTSVKTVEIYDPVANTWTAGPDMTTPRAYLGAAPDAAGNVYAIGGDASSVPSGSTAERLAVSPPPAISPPGTPQYHFYQPSGLSSGAAPRVPEQTTWVASGATNPTYQLQEQVNGGVWTTVFSGSATKFSTSVLPGSTFNFEARALSGSGVSAWAIGTPFSVDTFQEGAATYNGSWTSLSAFSYWGGTAKSTTSAGASATLHFTGRNVALIGTVGPSYGGFKEYVDGVLVRSPTAYASTVSYRRVLARWGWSVTGSHTIRIVNSASSGHPKLVIDGFVVFR